jgi:hypothetical protein
VAIDGQRLLILVVGADRPTTLTSPPILNLNATVNEVQQRGVTREYPFLSGGSDSKIPGSLNGWPKLT